MNKEHILLNIRELQEKMEALDERLFQDDEPVSALDLDTQLMHLRLLYDTYLSLRPEGKKKGKGRKEKEVAAPKAEETPEAVEEVETSLPLMFTDEMPEAPKAEEKPAAEAAPEAEEKTAAEAAPKAEEKPAVAEAPKEEKKPEVEEPVKKEIPKKEAKSEEKPEVKENLKEEVKAEEKAEEKVEEKVEETPEVDLDLLEDPAGSDFDMDAIEFEDEPEDDADEAPVAPKKKETAAEEEYEPYYPGLNPKAMEGEPEVGYATYASEKSTQTLGDRFAGQFPSLNDQLSQKKGEDRSLGSRKQKDQIRDLTKSIDLNLKFTFVRELFKGDARLLSEELNTLNECGRLETALSTFEEMKQRYHWKEDKEAVQQLYELILRKYSR